MGKIQADIGDVAAPRAIVEQTLAAFGPNIDILVNNAGIAVRKSFLETTVEDFDEGAVEASVDGIAEGAGRPGGESIDDGGEVVAIVGVAEGAGS